MSYDRFEEDWNGIPASEVRKNTPSQNLFGRHERHIAPEPTPAPEPVPKPEPVPETEPAPNKESRFIPKRYRKRPASKKKATFISSACCEWKSQAAKLPKSAILAGDVIWHKAGLERDKFVKEGRPESVPLELRSHLRKQLGVSASQMSRGIEALVNAGLVERLEKRPGKSQVVVLINVWLKKQREENEK